MAYKAKKKTGQDVKKMTEEKKKRNEKQTHLDGLTGGGSYVGRSFNFDDDISLYGFVTACVFHYTNSFQYCSLYFEGYQG